MNNKKKFTLFVCAFACIPCSSSLSMDPSAEPAKSIIEKEKAQKIAEREKKIENGDVVEVCPEEYDYLLPLQRPSVTKTKKRTSSRIFTGCRIGTCTGITLSFFPAVKLGIKKAAHLLVRRKSSTQVFATAMLIPGAIITASATLGGIIGTLVEKILKKRKRKRWQIIIQPKTDLN